MPHRAVLLLGLAAALYALCAFWEHYTDDDQCSMSYSRPLYVPLHFDSPNSKVSSKYQTYLYREGGESPAFAGPHDVGVLGGTPVLFLPGNAGSKAQGRSMASLASEQPEFDWFLVHFDEDLSAMHGKTLLDEAEYVNDVIAGILDLYQHHDGLDVKPQSVIIVAHSMGGLVARTLVALDSHVADSVNTIITLSTPHVYPPLTFDRDITQLYDAVNQFWRLHPNLTTSLVSIAGGHYDLMVLPDMTLVDSFGGLSVYSYEIPDVGIGINHQAIVWCAELRSAVVNAIKQISDHASPGRTLPAAERMQTLRHLLKKKLPQRTAATELGRSMLLGVPQTVNVSSESVLILPARSSLVSYTVRTSEPAHIAHETANEYRDYGVTDNAVLMWYSSGPYVPFKHDDQRLRLRVAPSAPVKVTVSVNWLATAANVAVHYRTLAACWPLAVVLLTTLIVLQRRISFAAAFAAFLQKWYLPLSAVLSLLHLSLCSAACRNFVRSLQVPSEAKNAHSLAVVGFDVHDLLVGVPDPEMAWLLPVLLAVSCCAVLVIVAASLCVVRLHMYLARRANCSLPAKRRSVVRYASVALGLALLYLIPYQVATCVLTVALLCRVSDPESFGFAFLQILLWTSAIDTPIVAVWLRNLNLQWLWAFATMRNMFSAAPIAMLALRGAQWLSNPRPFLFHVTQIVLLYIAAFAFVFGGLHAFMLHHLVNYLAAWLLVVMYDSSAPKTESRRGTAL